MCPHEKSLETYSTILVDHLEQSVPRNLKKSLDKGRIETIHIIGLFKIIKNTEKSPASLRNIAFTQICARSIKRFRIEKNRSLNCGQSCKPSFSQEKNCQILDFVEHKDVVYTNNRWRLWKNFKESGKENGGTRYKRKKRNSQDHSNAENGYNTVKSPESWGAER